MNFLHNPWKMGGQNFRVQVDLAGLSISASSAHVSDFIPFERFYILLKLLFKNPQLISK